MISAKFLASGPQERYSKQRYTWRLLTFQEGKTSGHACLLGHLQCFLSKFEFNNSADMSSKIEKWSTLDTAIFYGYLYCFLLFQACLFCIVLFVFQSKTVQDEGGTFLSLKIKLISSGDVLSTPSETHWVWWTASRGGDSFRGKPRVGPRVKKIEDYWLNLHFPPGCHGLRHRPNRGNMEKRKSPGVEEVLEGIVDTTSSYSAPSRC